MDFKKLYSDYLTLDHNDPSNTYSLFDHMPQRMKLFGLEIHNIINESIAYKDKTKLKFALITAYTDGIDRSYIKLISILLDETWHNEHEDLVNVIYLYNLDDDIFTDSLYQIAMEPDTFRKYDDELESTLRKCVHALKVINSEKANIYIEKLKNSKNSNVDSVLSMYAK